MYLSMFLKNGILVRLVCCSLMLMTSCGDIVTINTEDCRPESSKPVKLDGTIKKPKTDSTPQ